MKRDWLIAGGLVLATVAVYGQTLGFEFVFFDDNLYVTHNAWVRAGLGSDAVRAAFTEPSAPANWSPLVVLSFMLDTTLFGVDPAGFHATNVVLQALDVVLVYVLLRSLFGAVWPSALVAALFALHPLRVESVAWVSCRKDVLSAAFGFLALLAYGRFAQRGSWRAYLVSIVCTAAALMSKQTWVALPCLFLLLDFWPLRRVGFGAVSAPAPAGRPAGVGRLVAEKLPFFGLAAAATWAAIAYQSGNAIPADQIPTLDRIVHAVVACAWYVVKTFWPLHLAPHYPHPYIATVGGVPWTAAEIALSAALLIALSAAAVATARRGYTLVGWLWFLGTLVPVLGLVVQYGTQGMADRYTYLPHVGLWIAVVFTGWDLLAPRVRSPAARRLASATLVVVLLAFGSASFAQVRVWRDSLTLFSHALSVTPRNALIHKDIAIERLGAGRTDDALRHLKAALDIHPEDLTALRVLARTLEVRAGTASPPPPPPDFLIDGGPSDAVILEELAVVFHAHGDAEATEDHVRRALALAPDSARAHWQLGILLRDRGDLAGAAVEFRRVVDLAPDSQEAREALAAAERS